MAPSLLNNILHATTTTRIRADDGLEYEVDDSLIDGHGQLLQPPGPGRWEKRLVQDFNPDNTVESLHHELVWAPMVVSNPPNVGAASHNPVAAATNAATNTDNGECKFSFFSSFYFKYLLAHF